MPYPHSLAFCPWQLSHHRHHRYHRHHLEASHTVPILCLWLACLLDLHHQCVCLDLDTRQAVMVICVITGRSDNSQSYFSMLSPRFKHSNFLAPHLNADMKDAGKTINISQQQRPWSHHPLGKCSWFQYLGDDFLHQSYYNYGVPFSLLQPHLS